METRGIQVNTENPFWKAAAKEFDSKDFDSFFRNRVAEFTYIWSIYPPFNDLKNDLFKALEKSELKNMAVNLYIALQDSNNVAPVTNLLNELNEAWRQAKSRNVSPGDFRKTASFEKLENELANMANQVMSSHLDKIVTLDKKIKETMSFAIRGEKAKFKESQKTKDEFNSILKAAYGYAESATKKLAYVERDKTDRSLTLVVLYQKKIRELMHDGNLIGDLKQLQKELELLNKTLLPGLIKIKDNILSKLDVEPVFKRRLEKYIDNFPNKVSFDDIKKEAEELQRINEDVKKYPELLSGGTIIKKMTLQDEEKAVLKATIGLLDTINDMVESKMRERDIAMVVHNVVSRAELSSSDKEAVITAVTSHLAKSHPDLKLDEIIKTLSEAKQTASAEVPTKPAEDSAMIKRVGGTVNTSGIFSNLEKRGRTGAFLIGSARSTRQLSGLLPPVEESAKETKETATIESPTTRARSSHVKIAYKPTKEESEPGVEPEHRSPIIGRRGGNSGNK